jgi:hypothetical protein
MLRLIAGAGVGDATTTVGVTDGKDVLGVGVVAMGVGVRDGLEQPEIDNINAAVAISDKNGKLNFLFKGSPFNSDKFGKIHLMSARSRLFCF